MARFQNNLGKLVSENWTGTKHNFAAARDGDGGDNRNSLW